MHYRYLAAVYVGDTMFPLFMVTAETFDMLALEGRGDQAKIAAHLANCRLFAGNQVHENHKIRHV